METIKQNIKENSFRQIYLLYGEEDYLRRFFRDKLSDALVDRQDTMNYQYFEGGKISVEKLIDLAETLPFFAERRLIVVENSGFFGESSSEKFADYLGDVPPTTYFIFVEKKPDRRGRMFKICRDKGHAAEFKKQTEEMLATWIVQMVSREKKKITRRALETFQEYVGSDMENIISELEKLLCYTLEKDDITEADVEAVCIRQIDDKVFDMIEAALAGRQSKALSLYYDLLALKKPPRQILALITRQCNLLYQTKLLRGKGYDSRSIATKLSLKPFVASKYVAQAGRATAETLRRNLEQCVAGEEDINGGRLKDMICVELLLIEFCRA